MTGLKMLLEVSVLVMVMESCFASAPLPEFELNLDLPPEQRWVSIAEQHRHMVSSYQKVLYTVIPKQYMELATKIVDGLELEKYFPEEYAQELVGVARGLQMPVAEMFLMNLMYEATAFCTSILATDPDGNILHGRNLDFQFTHLLRNTTAVVHFQRNGSTIFTSAVMVPQITVFTVQKPEKFTLTIDQRLSGSKWIAVLEALLIKKTKTVGIFTRQVAEQCQSYDEALNLLKKGFLLAPVYFILGGLHGNEGAVITRGQLEFEDVYSLNSADGRWFLVETNYDHWKPAPKSDDRRDPAIKSMNEVGRQNVTLNAMYSVLSKAPVLNDQTVYTTVMSAAHPEQFKSLRRDVDE